MKVATMAFPNLAQTLTGLSALIGLANTTPVYSEERISPPVGEIAKATVGTQIWEHYSFVGVEGVIIDAPINARWGSVEEVDLPAGTGLFIIRERKLKACRERVTYSNLPGSPSIWTNCLVDSEDDGRFDKVIYSADGFSKRVEPPVHYKRGVVEVAGEGGSNFRKVIIYSGVGDGIIKFSYREFTNDMARPAFTEELALPLGKSFPQDVAIKDQVFTLLSLDGMGLTYQRLP
jgi:hypothetical protein